MLISSCLTLALINLRIAFGGVGRLQHLFFFCSAVSVAAVSAFELAILRCQSLTDCQMLLRWASVPLATMVTSVVGFVWSFFRTGNPVLAISGVVLLLAAQIANLVSEGPGVRGATALRQVETFGGVHYTLPVLTEGPWSIVEAASVLLVAVFVFDASSQLWRRGGGRRALIVGGSIIFFFVASRGHALLVEKGIVHTPYFVGFSFLIVLVAMGHELSDEVFRAARLSQALHESQRRMDLAAHAAKLGMWTWDLTKDEIWANETARELFEVPLSESINFTRFFQTIHPDDRPGVQNAVEAALSRGIEYDQEYRVLLSGGRERWIAARGRFEENGGDRPVLMRGVLMDITRAHNSDVELAQVRGQLTHAGRVSMMGQLASALAHELNQPLGAILRNAEAAELFLKEEVPNLEEVRAIISDIRKDDQRAGNVIDRLRALLKRRDIESQPLVVAELLAEVLALVRADASARRIILTVNFQPDLPPVLGDRVHLQQVLINLVINGMDALSESDSVERHVNINARRAGSNFIEVSVDDNGPGIPVERIQQVFDPFYTTKPHGMGMGLPISRTIVEAHGGRLTVENGPSGGSSFRFTLRVAEDKL
jgi:two-component system sensor kinase FixL